MDHPLLPEIKSRTGKRPVPRSECARQKQSAFERETWSFCVLM